MLSTANLIKHNFDINSEFVLSLKYFETKSRSDIKIIREPNCQFHPILAYLNYSDVSRIQDITILMNVSKYHEPTSKTDPKSNLPQFFSMITYSIDVFS